MPFSREHGRDMSPAIFEKYELALKVRNECLTAMKRGIPFEVFIPAAAEKHAKSKQEIEAMLYAGDGYSSFFLDIREILSGLKRGRQY